MSYSPVKFLGDKEFSIPYKRLPDVGEEVKFSRPCFEGVYPNQRCVGFEVLCGSVVSSSYGEKSHRHTLTILTETGKRLVQARTLLKFGAWRRPCFQFS